ncbi:ABC transporter substrate-binding protein (plasmid) [Gemmobacter aquarius]|uniref:ABC transporter substrate-binding protein n=1 Tax=Paragemmobacter aquarius TaxID=2169400 RepID=A0A2S0USR5_9RHOB|nr:metal ABC transporter substrate-binding protein [Gemmobacter aquarius]AWB50855.1 ABC transporter substrate-binding protein [Gemmobacter aquarius]
MITRRLLLASAAALAFAAPAWAEDKLRVIATFSILGDIVANVGGDRVEVTTLVGPDGDAHVFQPAPADAQAVAGAQVIVANGLGFEGWMDRLIEASGTTAVLINVSEGVSPIAFGEEEHAEEGGHEGHDHGDHAEGAGHDGHDHADHGDEAGHEGHDHGAFDPHAWQSPVNVALYVGNIAQGLTSVDPEGAAVYQANAASYIAELDALDAEIRTAVAALPEDRRTVVTSHDAFGYLAAGYGLTFVAPQGVSTEAEASAQDVAALITQIREQSIAAVFVENIADRRLLEQIATETGAAIGGTLYSDALSGPEGPAATYLAMMRHNLSQLTAALTN